MPEVWDGPAARDAHAGLQDQRTRITAVADALEEHAAALEAEATQLEESARSLDAAADDALREATAGPR